MKHWVDRLTDLAAVGLDETGLKSALTDLSESFGFGAKRCGDLFNLYPI